MTHVHEDIGAYVLGALDEEAARRVREHLAGCQDCAAAHAELAGIPALLDLATLTEAGEDEPLPPALEERLLDRFARERTDEPARRRRRPQLLWAGASALAGAVAAVALLVLGLDFERNGGRPESQYRVAFEQIGPAPANATARAGLRTSEAGTVLRLWVENLPAGAEDIYEVWCDAEGWSASAGTFKVDAQGNAYVILTTAVKRGQYDRIRLVRRERLADGKVETHDILGANLS